MAKCTFTKIIGDCVVAADHNTVEFLRKVRLGNNIHGDFTQQRNAGFHRKLFALFTLAFEYWIPGEIDCKYGVPEKNFVQFREDLTILAGHFHIVHRLDGTFRVIADSLRFGKMDQDTFDKLYNSVLNVVMKKISVLDRMTEDQINKLVDQVLSFA